tara:strand:+ start:58601 stop:59647 length:1047 start_codon:yes stop_codon:yes gene_type:complete
MPVKSFEAINPATDITSTRTFLHEVIPITGSIVSGTYSDNNIKNYVHGMFQSVYDYPYLSSSANHIFDLSLGFDESSVLSGSANVTQTSKKINMYNQFAQVLLGYTGSKNDVRMFESDLSLDMTGSMKEVFFINFSRLLTKDEIKKGSFRLSLSTAAWANPNQGTLTLGDYVARVDGTGVANAAGGDYAILHTSSTANIGELGHGVIFYQSGIAVITSSVFAGVAQFNQANGVNRTVNESLVSASITGSLDALRHRIQNISFNNTTEINSTIYFCRAPANKFNYSSNPTYTTGSKIRVKNIASDNPVSYITTVGLYNAANELLAVAKLSEPLKKTVDTDLTIRVRLDY